MSAKHFLNLLSTAAEVEGGRIIAVASLRSDYIHRCDQYLDLVAAINQQFLMLGLMTPEELTKAIALPALKVGAEIEPPLVNHIINEMQGEPGQMPLDEFCPA